MNKNPEKMEEASIFLRNISDEDRVYIIHDTDPDGICSAIILTKTIERLRKRKVEKKIPLDKKVKGISAEMAKQIIAEKTTKLITTDFSLDQNMPLIKKLEKHMDILSIDHHKLYNNYQSKKTTIIKPQLFTKTDPSKYCASKLAYDLCRKITDIEDLDWLAATACIADISTKPWMNWIKQVMKKHKIQYKKELFKTKLGEIAAIISSTEVYNEKLVPECLKAIYKTKTPEQALKCKFAKYKKTIDKELKKHIQNFKKAKRYGQMIIYELTSKYRINSVLSTILGQKYKHNTIIIINKSKPFINVSARRSDQKQAVNTLLENAVKGFKDANAGGHIPSAGAGFNKKYLNLFKQRIIKA